MSRLSNLLGLAKHVWTHADQLLLLLAALPPGLRQAGAGMEAAGAGAVLAGKAVGGSAAEQGNAAAAAQSVAQAIEECVLQVQGVAQQLHDLAAALDQVRVPKVTPVKQEFDFGLRKLDLVTSIKFDDGPALFGQVAGNMRAQAESMRTRLGGQLRIASESLSSIGQTLDSAGDSLASLGGALKEGGAALKQLGS